MLKKINKKHCSHDAYKQWEQCFLFIFFYHYSINDIYFSIIHKEPLTVFPRIEARASISFQQVFTPASK